MEVIADKYEIVKKLGEGGMGAVYLATHKNLDLPYAIKVIREEYTEREGFAERFKREATILTKLVHKNSVQLRDFGEWEGGFYMAMDYSPGRSLKEVIVEAGILEVDRGLDLMIQILEVLAEAHQLGIIHRDLKPANIIVEGSPEEGETIKVLDFGLAKMREGLSANLHTLTQEGSVMGTPMYMAPEQARSEDLDRRTDIYSLGMIMYVMFTGKLPYEADTSLQILMMQVEKYPPTFADLDLGNRYSSQLEGVIFKAIQKDPEKRFSSAEEFLQACRTLLQSHKNDPALAGELPTLDKLNSEIPTAKGQKPPSGLTAVTQTQIDSQSTESGRSGSRGEASKDKSSPLVAILVVLLLVVGGLLAAREMGILNISIRKTKVAKDDSSPSGTNQEKDPLSAETKKKDGEKSSEDSPRDSGEKEPKSDSSKEKDQSKESREKDGKKESNTPDEEEKNGSSKEEKKSSEKASKPEKWPPLPQLTSQERKRIQKLVADLKGYDYRKVGEAEKELKKMGQKALPVLVEALEEGKFSFHARVLKILNEMGKKAAPAVPALLKLIPEAESSRKKPLIRTVGKIGHPPSLLVPALLELDWGRIRSQKSTFRYAFRSLGEEAFDPLVKAWKEGDETTRKKVYYLVKHLPRDLSPKAIKSLVPLLEEGGREMKLAILGKYYRAPQLPREFFPPLFDLISHPQWRRVRYLATKALARKKSWTSDDVDPLLYKLKKKSIPPRGVIEILGEIGPPAAEKALPHFLRILEENPGKATLNKIICEALIKMGPRAVPGLVVILKQGSTSTRNKAKKALKSMGKKEAPQLVRALPRVDKLIQRELVQVIDWSQISPEKAASVLVKRVKDHPQTLMKPAFAPLRKIAEEKPAALVPHLDELLQINYFLVRKRGAELVEIIGAPAAQTVPVLALNLKRESNSGALIATLKALEKLGPAASGAAPSVRKLLNSGYALEAVKKQAQATLEAIEKK